MSSTPSVFPSILSQFHPARLFKMSPRQAGAALLYAAAFFALFGSLTALWKNPVFIRMSPVDGWDYLILAGEAWLLGVYLALGPAPCPVRGAGVGGVLAFLGFACPTCNKILMLVFGAGLLTGYFEPVQPLVGGAGLALMAWALAYKQALLQPAPLVRE